MNHQPNKIHVKGIERSLNLISKPCQVENHNLVEQHNQDKHGYPSSQMVLQPANNLLPFLRKEIRREFKLLQ